jgi:hypothetical protein
VTTVTASARSHRPILADKWLKALAEVGVIDEDDYIHRVVVDAKVGNWIRVYVERVGDDRLLEVTQTLHGVEISSAPASQEP